MNFLYNYLPARWRPQSADYEPLPGVSYHFPRRRLCVLVALVVLGLLAGVSLVSLVYDYDTLKVIRESVPKAWTRPFATSGPEMLSLESVVVGPPTLSFRDNLRNDTKYVTTWTTSGWTNNLMTYLNMVYIGMITDRVPIIPPFSGGHVPDSAGSIDFGDIFDIPRFSRAINLPVLDWRDVKNYSDPEAQWDDVGCWSVWATANQKEGKPRGNKQESVLKLDVAYTPIPTNTKLFPQQPGDVHVSFWGLAQLSFPIGRKKAINNQPAKFPSKKHNHTSSPDDHLMCFDFVYYTSYMEYESDFSPAWRFVASHLHWSPWIEKIGNEYLRKTFGLAPSGTIPPYIGIHLRRDDFSWACKDKKVELEECFAPLDTFERRVDEVRAALLASPRFTFTANDTAALPVIVTSDDTSDAFWADVAAHGWLRVDHGALGTEEKYGMWYAPVLDAYFQSAGIGFVGTDRSTMSLFAKRRVEDWHGGEGRMVKWGSKDADAH